MAKLTKPTTEDVQWSDPLPPPIQVDGYWRPEGEEPIEGVVISVEKSRGKYQGETLLVRTTKPTLNARDGQFEVCEPGKVLAVTVWQQLEPVADMYREKGAIRVKITPKGKRGKAFALDVRTAEGF